MTKVPTADNLADMFTKALARDPFTKLRRLVMNILVRGILAPLPRARRIAASKGARGCEGVLTGMDTVV